MAVLFGYKINKPEEIQKKKNLSFVPPTTDDGTENISAFNYDQFTYDANKNINEISLIRRYRDASQQPECASAIDDIVNESIVYDNQNKKIVDIEIFDDNLEKKDKIPEKVKTAIHNEFQNVLRLLNFNQMGADIFKKWYVDGKLFYHKILKETDDKVERSEGIIELRNIDPTKIKRIQINKNEIDHKLGFTKISDVEVYFLYNEKGMSSKSRSGLKIAKDAIAYAPSGLTDQNDGKSLSYLFKALKAVSQLRMIEDSLVIYRLVRAPERRIFYIDTGGLQGQKAEAYLNNIMTRYRNKISYNTESGKIYGERNRMSMLEDFWVPRTGDGKGTEITTLQGGQNLGQIEDIEYFKAKLYRSLGVPVSRLESSEGFNIGRTTEVTRDEVKFNKFINRVRKKFSVLFTNILETQILVKNIMSSRDWEKVKDIIYYNFYTDNHFAELKNLEIWGAKTEAVSSFDSLIEQGYFSKAWIKKNILNLSDEEIETMDKEVEAEKKTEGTDDKDDDDKGRKW